MYVKIFVKRFKAKKENKCIEWKLTFFNQLHLKQMDIVQ